MDRVKKHIIVYITEQAEKLLKKLILWADVADKECVINVENFTEQLLFPNTKTDQNANIPMSGEAAYHLKILLTSNINLKPDFALYSKLYLTENLKNLEMELEDPKQMNNGPVLPKPDDLIKFRQYLTKLIVEKLARDNDFEKLRDEIADLNMKLAIVNPGDATIGQENLTALFEIRDQLKTEYDLMRENIDQMKNELEAIWTLLLVDDPNITKQFEGDDYSRQLFCKITQVLSDWREKQESHLKAVISQKRQEITTLWYATFCSQMEQAKFLSFTSTSFTVDLLREHETESKRLTDYYYDNLQLFGLINKRKLHCSNLKVLDVKDTAPDRFKNRGGSLLHQQKERKVITRQLAIVEQKIQILAQDYQKLTNKPFTVDGIPVLEIINKKEYENFKRKNHGRRTLMAPVMMRPIPTVEILNSTFLT